MQPRLIVLTLIIAVLLLAGYFVWQGNTPQWSAEERAAITALWLGNLPALPPDPSNRYGDDPRAAALGEKLFNDTRFSSNGAVACATCHQPELDFQDSRQFGVGVGVTDRRTMPIVGTAYSPWLFWDGRKDSQWAQALGPLENPVEHGGTRTQYAHLLAQHYRTDYEAIFGPLPDLTDPQRFPAVAGPVAEPLARANWEKMTPEDRELVTRIYVNLGKAIAAYERTLLPKPTRFDRYAEAVINNDVTAQQALFSADEVAGLRLFIGPAQCIRCHNGPLFTNNDFHNTGVPPVNGRLDVGRANGVQQALTDEFNCRSLYSDAASESCSELRFAQTDMQVTLGAFKPPSLRNVANHAPYMHAGQIATLREVLLHYNQAPAPLLGHGELEALHIDQPARAQLEAFLHTLNSEQ